MRNRWLVNLVLLIAVALLGWLALTDTADEISVNKLVDIDPLSITNMRIQHASQPAIELQKRGAQWHMSTPYNALANNMHINRLLSVLETPSHAQFSADRQLEQYGLAQPEVRISMNESIHIELGAIEPLSRRRYVRTGDTVHVIGDSPFAQLTAAASLLIDTALFSDTDTLQSIRLPSQHLVRQDNGSWKTSPPSAHSADALNDFVQKWQHARAVFVSDPEKKPSPGETVFISMADNTGYEFGIIRINTGVTLVNLNTGLHYHFAEDAGKQLLELPVPSSPATQ